MLVAEFYKRFPTQLGLVHTAEAQEQKALAGAELLDKKSSFVLSYYKAAIAAARQFKLNPVIVLAQAALESGWGTSTLAKQYHNFFGMTAAGKPNAYWKGESYTSTSSGLKFRVYPSVEAGFADFARVISSYYQEAAAVSTNINAYADKIANSKYISETNGDNRQRYKELIISAATSILGIAKKKFQTNPLL
jgi:peptidoglycan hydrolase FlgJ